MKLKVHLDLFSSCLKDPFLFKYHPIQTMTRGQLLTMNTQGAENEVS